MIKLFEEEILFRLHNLSGRLVKRVPLPRVENNTAFNLQDLRTSAGQYLLVVMVSAEIYSEMLCGGCRHINRSAAQG